MMLIRFKQALNSWFWQLVGQQGNTVKLIGIEESRPFIGSHDNIFNEDMARSWRKGLEGPMDGGCYRIDRLCLIEPSYGYALVGFNKIARGSVFFPNIRPSLNTYLKYKLLKKGRERFIDTAVLFDGNLGNNYFHFFTDMFNKLWLLEKYNIDKATPLIIGRKTFDTRFFQSLYKDPRVSNHNWVIQEVDEFIKCKTLFFIKPAPYNLALWGHTLALVQSARSTAEPHRRIFLTRPAHLDRTVNNMEDLMPIIEKYGFEPVDPGSLSFEDQVRLFSESRFLAGVQGSAFTNIAFTYANKARVLELNALDRPNGQMYMLAMAFHVEYYDAILGDKLVNRKFEMSVDVFEAAIQRLLNVEPA